MANLSAMDGERVIGGYVLRRVLGRGGMGEVHLAATPTGGLAAIKIIHPELARDPAFRRRFQREVAAARRVARFCTAPVLDSGFDGDTAYLVTEYVKGPDLAHAVRDQGAYSGANLEALAVGIATALSAIHGAGVIHRDLKPSNVLLSPLGPRVIDFGIAQIVEGDSSASQAILGTPAFMAPEQVRGEVLTPAADVYAWGGVIAFAGTGRLPFGGGAPHEVLYKIVNEGPRLDGLDPGMRGLVERALAKDPRGRPTAQQVLAELVGHQRLTPETATQVVERTWTGPGAAGMPKTRQDPFTPGPEISGPQQGWGPGGSGSPQGRGPEISGPQQGWGPGGSGSPQGRGPEISGPQQGRGPGGSEPQQGWAPGGSGAQGKGSRPTAFGAGKRKRWPWVVGAGVLAVVVAGAIVVPQLTRQSWPYTADFKDAWAVGASEGGNASQTATGYELTAKAGWRLWKSAPRSEPAGGVVVTANVKLEEGKGEYGVWCHGTATGADRYEFTVNDQGKASIVKRRTGQKPTILYGPADANQPKDARIVAECTGDTGKATLRLWVDEQRLAEVSDTDNPYGPAETGVLAAPSGDAPVRVLFTTFTVQPAKG